MIIVQHDFNKVTNVSKEDISISFTNQSIAQNLINLSNKYDNELLIWVHQDYFNELNLDEMQDIFHHQKIMASFAPVNYLGKEVGYLEDSPFIKINRAVNYPTWQMSSLVGGMNTSVIKAIASQIKPNKDVDYFLNSLAKLVMPQGIFCYSNPSLLKCQVENITLPNAKLAQLFQFTAEHYKRRWTILLFLNLLIFQKQVSLLSFLQCLFYRRVVLKEGSFEHIQVVSSKQEELIKEVDVIIPTIGRKEHLYNVLNDFSVQSLLPKRIIIVEQNPNKNATSELDYIYQEKWPFEIIHKYINQTGACNARNIALDLVKSEWTFLADDDIRFKYNLIENTFNFITSYRVQAVNFRVYQKNQKLKSDDYIHQWPAFGSGCSLVASKYIHAARFDMSYEFGFGEDSDFGIQLRNLGADVIYMPEGEILHLKAPIGGFRFKVDLPWSNLNLKPKPSPTVMLYKIKNNTKEQLEMYKLISFFNFFKGFKLIDKVLYPFVFNKKWQLSKKYALKLNQK